MPGCGDSAGFFGFDGDGGGDMQIVLLHAAAGWVVGCTLVLLLSDFFLAEYSRDIDICI